MTRNTMGRSKHIKRFSTKQEWVLHELREMIISCELAPGERLILDDLAGELGLSRVPVREALLQLQVEGLVISTPHEGAVVAPISPSTIVDYFAISGELQVLAAKAVCRTCTSEKLKVLEQEMTEMDESISANDMERFTLQNFQFHVTMGELSEVPMLTLFLKILQQNWRRIAVYYGLDPMTNERAMDARAEHRTMLTAIASGDVEETERQARKHNLTGLDDHLKRVAQIQERR